MTRWQSFGTTFLLILTTAGPLFAQQPATGDTASYEQGWYVVRPGDTMEEITRLYLGSSRLWQLNHSLNPDVNNPHVLHPGQLLRILIQTSLPPRTAKVLSVSRGVEKNPVPLTWFDATREDLLLGDDGVRTLRNSSTELQLSDGTRMAVTENSLVYLKKAQRRVKQPQAVEIVHGQADLETLAGAGESDGVEIILGTALARPRATAEGSETRARRPDAGGAQIMVYRGESDVEAAGKTVQVGHGMGTSVPNQGPPAAPERLLEAPATIAPVAGTRLNFGNPTMRWQEVAQARSYTLEICHDAACGQLVQRQVGITETSLTATPLPIGDLHWRVTAVSDSGLDGFPSPTVAFTILSSGSDALPPTGMIRATGPQYEHDAQLCLGAGAKLTVEIEDGESGPGSWQGRLDDSEVAAEAWQGPWSPGRHSASATIFDRAGNSAQLAPFAFTYDPDAPQITSRVVPLDWPGHRGVAARVWPESGGRSGGPPLRWSVAGASWQPLGNAVWWLADPDAHLILRPETGSLRIAELGIEVSQQQVLLIEAPDSGCGLSQLRFSARAAGGGWQLVIEATDYLGNTTTTEWSLSI